MDNKIFLQITYIHPPYQLCGHLVVFIRTLLVVIKKTNSKWLYLKKFSWLNVTEKSWLLTQLNSVLKWCNQELVSLHLSGRFSHFRGKDD